MKRALLILWFHVSLTLATAQPEPTFAEHLALYRQQTSVALAAETEPKARRYLEESLSNASRLDELEPGHPDFSGALRDVAKRRRELDDILTPTNGVSSITERVEKEQAAHNAHINRYIRPEFIVKAGLQADLLELKYFTTKTAKNANVIEGYINGRWSLTRADDRKIDNDTLGVKPWEAICRLEPTVAFRGGAQPAIVGALGLSYTFFPRLNRATMKLDPTPESKWLKKTGVRLGAGAGRFDDHTRFLIGPGVQISALAIWGLYSPKDKSMMLGLSTADLSKLKKVFGYFD